MALERSCRASGFCRRRTRRHGSGARVAGDAVDLATLGPGSATPTTRPENVIVAVAAVAGVTMLDAVCAQRLSRQRRTRAANRRRLRARDYSNRRGMPGSPEAMRGAARDLKVPEDMRIPAALRPYTTRSSLEPVCERSNCNKETGDKVFGHTTAGLFGYTHLTGGYPGGQAEYVRVPYADVGPVKIENGLTDEQVLFLSDIFPTGWQAVVQCDIEPTDTVAIWGWDRSASSASAARSCSAPGR